MVAKRHISCDEFNEKMLNDDIVVDFKEMKPNKPFQLIYNYSDLIKNDLITNLNTKYIQCLKYDFGNSILMHIRLGDFLKSDINKLKSGSTSMSTPINWFCDIVKEIRTILGYNIKVYVFSDGTDKQLLDVINLPNVHRITFGSSIADMLALSRAKLFIQSGSTFSLWARFLGRLNTISFPGQLMEKLKKDDEDFIECEVENKFFDKDIAYIKRIFN